MRHLPLLAAAGLVFLLSQVCPAGTNQHKGKNNGTDERRSNAVGCGVSAKSRTHSTIANTSLAAVCGKGGKTRTASAVPICSRDSGAITQQYIVTAYCPCKVCCGPKAKGITASGRPVSANGGKFCAAPKSIRFGTRITIPGYGTVPVLDRGGAIKEGRLDVFFPSHLLAKRWGVRTLTVTIHK